MDNAKRKLIAGKISPEVVEIARALAGSEAAPAAPPPAPEVELALADLLSDENGEIVFFNDSGVRTLGIATEQRVIERGRAGAHVTAGGENVTGYSFVTFESGLTLYFQEGIDLLLQPL